MADEVPAESPPPSAPPSMAEVESLASSLADLASRLGKIAERFAAGGDEFRATELFEVERALHTARRRLDQATG